MMELISLKVLVIVWASVDGMQWDDQVSRPMQASECYELQARMIAKKFEGVSNIYCRDVRAPFGKHM